MNSRYPITINETEYKVGFSLRAIKLFEEMAGKSIEQSSGTWDNVIYCYASLKALNENFTMTLDQFVDALDEDPQLFIDLQYNTKETTETQAPTETKKKLSAISFLWLWMLSLFVWAAPVLIPVIFGSIWIFRSLKKLLKLIAGRGNKHE